MAQRHNHRDLSQHSVSNHARCAEFPCFVPSRVACDACDCQEPLDLAPHNQHTHPLNEPPSSTACPEAVPQPACSQLKTLTNSIASERHAWQLAAAAHTRAKALSMRVAELFEQLDVKPECSAPATHIA